MTRWIRGTWRAPFLMIILSVLLTACGGGGSGGSGSGGTDVPALVLPSRIELTSVDDGDVGALAMLRQAAVYSDTGTDYSNEEKQSWVDDTDALEMINDILGVCKDTGYANFVNQGPYKALVRQVGKSEQSKSGNNTTSQATEQLMEMYVDVTRASSSAPMIVKIWVEEDDGPMGQPQLIRGHFTVTQGVSATYPYGVMTANFKGTTLDGSVDMFHMAMSITAEGGNVVVQTVDDSEEGGEFENHSKVKVVANQDITEGNAYVWESETHPDWEGGDPVTETSEELIAFNADYFKVTENSVDSYYSKANLRHRIFNYKLFNAADGSNLDLSSGFPIETAEGKHGYVGYYGIWAPPGVDISNGATVSDMDGNTYTVYRSGGKLTKHTQSSTTLATLSGMELSYWQCDQSQCGDVIVTWNGSNFIKLGVRNQNTGAIQYYTDTDPEYHAVVTFSEWDGAWCEGLQAFLRIGNLYANSNTPSDASTVYYDAEQTLDPETATDMTLYTWEFTLGLPIDQTVVNGSDVAMNAYWGGMPTEKTFQFVASEMMLYDQSLTNAVILPDGLTLDGTNLQWGYHIGPLTTTRYDISNFWQAHEAQVFYSWNTGEDEWNQFTTLKDSSNAFVSFDAPISFSYTHTTAKDVNADGTYDGKVFRMDYDGTSVHIPWEYDQGSGDWEPQINIRDGVTVGDSNQYVIKATEEELVMEAIAEPAGTTFPTNSVGAPDLVYDATKTAQVGAIPTTAQLKVIKGEVLP